MSPSRLLAAASLLAIFQTLHADTATVEGSAGTSSDDVTVTVIIDSDRDGLTDAGDLAVLLASWGACP